MVGKEDFKKKAKEMAEKARAKAQGEKAEKAEKARQGEQGEQGRQGEAERSGFRPSESAEKLKKEHGEGPERW